MKSIAGPISTRRALLAAAFLGRAGYCFTTPESQAKKLLRRSPWVQKVKMSFAPELSLSGGTWSELPPGIPSRRTHLATVLVEWTSAAPVREARKTPVPVPAARAASEYIVSVMDLPVSVKGASAQLICHGMPSTKASHAEPKRGNPPEMISYFFPADRRFEKSDVVHFQLTFTRTDALLFASFPIAKMVTAAGNVALL